MLTQDELGKRAGLSGYTISRIESEQVEPRVSTMRKIAGALGIKPEELAARPKAEASRPEEAFRVVGRIVEDENGDQSSRWVVKWSAPPAERGQYREIIAELISGDEYDEEELTPEEARVLMAGAV
jgi:transcriptional regulator with XRE-family HTH domain